MEARLGANFESVRLHTGSDAVQLNRAVEAQAFTHGRDIYLAEGHQNIESAAGQKLLAHELTHTVQQGAAPVAAPVQKSAAPVAAPIQRQPDLTAAPHPQAASAPVQHDAVPAIQRKINSGYGTNKVRVVNNIKQKLGVKDLTPQQKTLVDQFWDDPNSSYSIDSVVEALKARAQPGMTHGPVTVISQKTEAPKLDTKEQTQFGQVVDPLTQISSYGVIKKDVYKGEKAHASFKAMVNLVGSDPNTKVGYLQTLRFSRRALKIGATLQPGFNMSNVRDGAEENAPWMVPPKPATGPVLLEMLDEPGQYGLPDEAEVSAVGTDVFTTWLVSTTKDTPMSEGQVQFLYHWNWKVDWTGKACQILSAGPGRGSNQPTFEGTGARKLYNNFLKYGGSGFSRPHQKFQEAAHQLKEGLKGPNLDTDVDPKLLKDALTEMQDAWNNMDEIKQEKHRFLVLEVLDEYMLRIHRRRPAQRYLGEELGFKGL